MTFTRQLRTSRLTLTALVVLAVFVNVLVVFHQQWTNLVILLPSIAVSAWAVHVYWRLLGRQRDFADLADQLRAVAREIPSGMDRIYTSVTTTTAIHCRPGNGRGSDQFSEFDMADMDDLDRTEPGTSVNLPAVTYQVRRPAPIVWRRTWADQAVKAAEPGKYVTLPQRRTNFRDLMRLIMLNHRTGVLVPDRSELEGLLHAIQNADHIGDTPQKPRSQGR